MKIKVCVSCEERESRHGGYGGYLGYAVSNMDDRKATIKLLRKVERGSFWDDLAYDYIHQFKIAPKKSFAEDGGTELTEKEIDRLLMITTPEKWRKFVKVFVSPGDGRFEIRTINI
jgi:hypothetical protein